MKQQQVAKLVDFSLLFVATVLFVGLVSFHPETIFLKEAPYHIPPQYGVYFEILLWIFFAMLAFDLYLKYQKLGRWGLFLRKHWFDIILFILIPFLTIFKIAKISLKLIKTIKTSKTGFKVFYKAKKTSKHFKP